MFPKLSKLLNQEDALGTPWLHGHCSPQARPRGALLTSVTRHFDVTLSLAAPKSSRWQALMSPRWWRRMHGQRVPVQGQAEPS
jgi:hypothetical protein